MNQPRRVQNNNNSSQFAYYVNRRNLMPEHANFTGNRVPVFIPNRNKVYTESEQSNTIPNRNAVNRGERSNVELPPLYAGTLKSSNYSHFVKSSATTITRPNEHTNNNLEEISENQISKRNSMVSFQTSSTGHTSTNNFSKPKKSEDTNTEIKPFGASPSEKLCIFTGTVEKLIQWNKILTHNLCYYEVIARMVSLKEGAVRTQKIMLLRNITGPILQVVYYTVTHIDVDDFHLGKTVRCVGYMTGHNIFNAFSIRGATQEEIDNLQRFTLISDQAVSLKSKN